VCHGSSDLEHHRNELRPLRRADHEGLDQLDGVQVKSVTVGEAIVDYDQRKISPSEMIQAVNEAGYEARLVRRVA